MKKLCVLAVTMLLALVLFSCNGLITPSETETGGTGAVSADGTPLVELSVGAVDLDRSLTLPLAKAGVNYYEVVFITGTTDGSSVETIEEIYRTSWTNTSRSKIAIPAGIYDNTVQATADFAKAYMFAGRADGTLLALGTLVDSNVTATTKTVDFKLVPLLTDVNDGADAAKPSTFQFTTAATTRALTIDGTSYTAFLQGPSVTDSPATYKIGIKTTGTADTIITVFKDALRLAPDSIDPVPMIDSKGWFDAALATNKGLPALTAEFSNLNQETTASKFVNFSANSANTMQYVDLKMYIDTSTQTGYALMWFEVPVFLATEKYLVADGIPAETAAPFTWYLRGGVRNDSADAGITINGETGSTGGAVVIGVFPANEANGIDVGGSVVTP